MYDSNRRDPAPTRPQQVHQPGGPTFAPSQPAQPPAPSPQPALNNAPAHQVPRQPNRLGRHKILSGIGLAVITAVILIIVATSGNSGSGKPVPRTIGYSGSNAVEFAEAAGITDYEGLDQVPGKPAPFGTLDGGMWGAPGNGAGSLGCWLTHAGLVNWEHVHRTASNVQTVDLSEYCAAWVVTS